MKTKIHQAILKDYGDPYDLAIAGEQTGDTLADWIHRTVEDALEDGEKDPCVSCDDLLSAGAAELSSVADALTEASPRELAGEPSWKPGRNSLLKDAPKGLLSLLDNVAKTYGVEVELSAVEGPGRCGDLLADFLVAELRDVYKEAQDTEEARECAIEAIEKAVRQINGAAMAAEAADIQEQPQEEGITP
jgi:hypothetical protein